MDLFKRKSWAIWPMLIALSFLVLAMAERGRVPVARVGYASASTMVKGLPETQTALKEMDSLRKQFEEEFNRKVGEYKNKATDLERSSQQMNALVRKEREAELRTLQLGISRFQQQADSAYKANETRLMKPLFDKVQKAMSEVAVQHGFTHILNNDVQNIPLILYADKGTNADSLVMLKLKTKK